MNECFLSNLGTQYCKINKVTFKYHVSCADEKISVRVIYLFFHRRPTHKLCFLSCRPFVVNATFSRGLIGCQETEETSTPYKTCSKCHVNDERPTGKKTQLVSGMTMEK